MTDQQQPDTAVPHPGEQIRDIPKSCICRSWHWIDHRWELLSIEPGCPWHDEAARFEIMHDAAMAERALPWSAEVLP